MRIVTANEREQWLEQGTLIEGDCRGPKVLRLTDGRLLKIFRPRRRLWLARLMPAARRFSDNALRLSACGIRTPVVEECLWLNKQEAVSACLYVPLPGCSLESVYLRDPDGFRAMLPKLAHYIKGLHQQGIYFRSLHLGNVLNLPEGGFGLIDFLDLRFRKAPLAPRLVQRNLLHMKNYLKRIKRNDFPWQEFLDLLYEVDNH